MLTDRGRWILALGGGIYLAAWALGSRVLYPVAIGLVLAVLAASLWVRFLQRPMSLRRNFGRGERLAGDDIPVQVELDADGFVPSGTLILRERVARLGERETALTRRHGRLRGRYLLRRVPRGRYPIEEAEVVIEDPFGLERATVGLPTGASILVYPRLVDVDRLFSESGARTPEGRRLLMRRPTGFDLHSVRDYQQGESLRRVHWPTTARRGQLMVKDLEDSPRDEALVVLDADVAFDVGTPPESSFELAVSAAGSILRAHAGRGRRAGLLVNGIEPRYQQVHSLDGDWGLALELLASARSDGRSPVAALLVEGAGMPSKALELCVVTSGLSARLADRLLQRAVTRRSTSLVYVDPASFAASPAEIPTEVRVQLARLDHSGIPVCVLRRGDDLAARLGPDLARAEAVG